MLPGYLVIVFNDDERLKFVVKSFAYGERPIDDFDLFSFEGMAIAYEAPVRFGIVTIKIHLDNLPKFIFVNDKEFQIRETRFYKDAVYMEFVFERNSDKNFIVGFSNLNMTELKEKQAENWSKKENPPDLSKTYFLKTDDCGTSRLVPFDSINSKFFRLKIDLETSLGTCLARRGMDRKIMTKHNCFLQMM